MQRDEPARRTRRARTSSSTPDNPVDWYPWGDEALAQAREEDKPILLSIGYAACHWCHVMAHESFEDPATAALMNELFVNVKVDREERPDVDAIYMDAVVALTGHGGWPMTVFLTPAGEPFFGGTYFPPEPRHGLPSFRQVLVAVSRALPRAARRRRRGGRRRSSTPCAQSARRRAVARAADRVAARRGGAPAARELRRPGVGRLRPRAEVPARVGARAPAAPRRARTSPTKTLDAMALGGMYDLVGGGFHRYSVDERWLVPHFEKMLYDNALLVPAYLHGWLVTGEERYREVVEETVEYLLRELRCRRAASPRRRTRTPTASRG